MKRKTILSMPIALLAATALPWAAGAAQTVDSAGTNLIEAARAPAAGRPNIIVVLADDMGYSDLGFFGSGIRTPTLDALARRGLTFTQFYNESKCTESRAALLSGRPHRAVLAPAANGTRTDATLAAEVPTLADLLRAQGYATFISGKWHLGEQADLWPNKRGFDRSFSLVTGASSYFEMRMREAQDDPVESKFWPSKPFMVRDGQRWPVPERGFYMTDAIGAQAREMVASHTAARTGKPFFLYLAYTAPHFPLHARPKDIARYRGKFDGGWDAWRARRLSAMKRRGLIPAGAQLAPRPKDIEPWLTVAGKAEWARRMEVYAAQLEGLDRDLAKLVKQLKAHGEFDNTVILFLSDNGAASMSPEAMARDFGYVVPGAVIGTRESNTSYGEPWAAVSNTPLNDYKQSLYEGGIRTPLIVHWPAGLKRRGMAPMAGQITDILPTALSLAGADRMPAAVSGANFAPWLRGAAAQPHPLFWAYKRQAAVREGTWKLLSTDGGKSWRLFDLNADPTEQTDLSAIHPERAAALRAKWQEWAAGAGKPYGRDKARP